MSGNNPNSKRLISVDKRRGEIQIYSGNLNIDKFRDLRYWSFSFTRISNWIGGEGQKSRAQKLRNFGQMTKVLSDENAKNFTTFFSTPTANKWLKNSKYIKKRIL